MKTSTIQLGFFCADVTPSIGEPINGGLSPSVKTIEHPLLAKGIILKSSNQICVLCAIDFAGICNDSYRLLRVAIARAAKTNPERVVVQSVHQHTSVSLDQTALQLIRTMPNFPLIQSAGFESLVIKKMVQAVRRGLRHLHQVTHVGTGWAPVNAVASSRRTCQPDGSILVRYSSARDTDRQAAPEGYIDGYLRTVAFFNGKKPLVHLHYYATHPQSFYNDRRISYDVPGIAREQLQKQTGVFQIYFTGCGGDIAMGKYNDGTRQSRQRMVARLKKGMAQSIARIQREKAKAFSWQTLRFKPQLRQGPGFDPSECRAIMNDIKAVPNDRIRALQFLAFATHQEKNPGFDISCFKIGRVQVLHLFGEPFVEYQIWAQKQQPDLFVAVAGYGDCAPWYLCTDDVTWKNSGYELLWSFIGPCEKQLKDAMARLLRFGKRPKFPKTENS